MYWRLCLHLGLAILLLTGSLSAADEESPAVPEESTPASLITAVRAGDLHAVRELLAGQAALDERDQEGRTPLIWAAMKGQEDIIRLLLDKGAQLDIEEKRGGTALSAAIVNEWVSVVQLLLDKGADLHASFTKEMQGVKPIILAAQAGNLDILRLLLARKADINYTVPDKYRTTPLYSALLHRNIDVAAELAARGAGFQPYRRKSDGKVLLRILADACLAAQKASKAPAFRGLHCFRIHPSRLRDQNETWVELAAYQGEPVAPPNTVEARANLAAFQFLLRAEKQGWFRLRRHGAGSALEIAPRSPERFEVTVTGGGGGAWGAATPADCDFVGSCSTEGTFATLEAEALLSPGKEGPGKILLTGEDRTRGHSLLLKFKLPYVQVVQDNTSFCPMRSRFTGQYLWAPLKEGPLRYQGKIGKRLAITMTLARKGPEYRGAYAYKPSAKPIELTGEMDINDEIRLSETVEGKVTGGFKGQIAPGGAFTGTWVSSWTAPKKRLPFVLKPVP